jgi:pimeloyl-ACP methyl ester carboxylesterase
LTSIFALDVGYAILMDMDTSNASPQTQTPRPAAPAPSPDQYTHTWKTSGETKYLRLPDGAEIRYVEAGSGQPLVLLHPLRAQLDYFQRLIPLLLQDDYRILALDLPGFGYSKIPAQAVPDEPYLRGSVVAFMKALDLKDAVLLGESIGATLALTTAAAVPERVTRVAAINPYDYGERFGGGVRRSKGGALVGLFELLGQYTPESKAMVRRLLEGGLTDPRDLPAALVAEFDAVGRRPGYRRTEARLYQHWHSWVDAIEHYRNVTAPVTLVYGDQDWSKPEERDVRRQLLPKAARCLLTDASHFLSLQRPEQIESLIGGDLLDG